MVESAEAVSKVEQWLLDVYGSDGGLRADPEHIVRTPEGWHVPYNNIAYLDGGQPEKAIFPPPYLVVTEPDGELRFAGAYPGMLSTPVTYPDQPYWEELIDPEWEQSGFDRFGVPKAAIGGWQEMDPDDNPTGQERSNPDYITGAIRRGANRPENQLEKLLMFVSIHWLDDSKYLAGLVECDVYLPRAEESDKATRNPIHEQQNIVKVYTSTKWLPGQTHAWQRRDLLSLAEEFDPATKFVILGPPLYASAVQGAQILAAAAEFPRFSPRVNELGVCPEISDGVIALDRDMAAQLGLPQPAGVPTRAAHIARHRGYELTEDECRKLVLAGAWLARNRLPQPPPWPVDLVANGLAQGRFGMRAESFGKVSDLGWMGRGIGWHRVVGAYVGFAIGEAVATDFQGPRPATARLVEITEALIRSDLNAGDDYDTNVADLSAALDALVPRGGPDDGALGLIGALPVVLTLISRNTGVPYGESERAGRVLAAHLGLTGEPELTAAVYLGLLFERLVENEFSVPERAFERAYPPVRMASTLSLEGREGSGWDEVRALADQSLIKLRSRGLHDLPVASSIGDGRSVLSVLGRAIAAVSGRENYPVDALTEAVRAADGNPLIVALAGALIGARTGIPGLPIDLVEMLDTRWDIEDLASHAMAKMESDLPHPDMGQWFRRYPPVPGGRIAAEQRAGRVRGCLFGGAIGDALGAPIEFLTSNQIIAKHGPDGVTGFVENPDGTGRITDDTQMTLFTAEGLIRAHAQARRTGSSDVRLSLQLAYQRWLHTQGQHWARVRGPQQRTEAPDGWLVTNEGLHHRRAPGATCFASLENYGRTGEMGTFEHKLNDSKGCGGVMRAAPVALWSADPAEVFRLAAVSAALTHGHPSGYLSAGVLAVIVRGLIDEATLPAAIDTARAQLVEWPDHQEQLALLDAAVALAAEGDPSPAKVERLGSGFVGESALAIAVYAALVTDDPVRALLISVNHGGDSDSTGAICGNIVGARDGVRWTYRWKTDQDAIIRQVANDLIAEFGDHPPTGDTWHERYPSDELEPLWPTE